MLREPLIFTVIPLRFSWAVCIAPIDTPTILLDLLRRNLDSKPQIFTDRHRSVSPIIRDDPWLLKFCRIPAAGIVSLANEPFCINRVYFVLSGWRAGFGLVEISACGAVSRIRSIWQNPGQNRAKCGSSLNSKIPILKRAKSARM